VLNKALTTDLTTGFPEAGPLGGPLLDAFSSYSSPSLSPLSAIKQDTN
jgi:hypothetical protein